MRKADVGKSHGLLGFTSTTYVTDPITTIGTTRSVEFPANGFAVADLPPEARFTCKGVDDAATADNNITMHNQAGTSSYTQAVLYGNAQFNDGRTYTSTPVSSNPASPALSCTCCPCRSRPLPTGASSPARCCPRPRRGSAG